MTNIVVRDGNQNPVIVKTLDVDGVQVSQSVPSDATGAPYTQTNPLPTAAGTGTLVSRSVTTVASTSTELFPENATRRYMSFQAPQAADIWWNPRGGTAGAEAVDCFCLPAGAMFESGQFVVTGAVTYWCAEADLVITAVEA